MFARILEKFINTSFYKTITVIGGLGGIKYTYDSLQEILKPNTDIYDNEQIEKIILTDKDKEILTQFSKKELSEQEMKQLKYTILKTIEKQKLEKKLKKYQIDLNDSLYDDLTSKTKSKKKD